MAAVLQHPMFFPACIGVVAIVLLIIIGLNVSRCAAGDGNVEEVQQAEEVQEVQQEGNPVNADVPEDLRWRDEEFKLDPTRTTWTTKDNGRKVVYLTLDDGPSDLTEKFLDLFDQLNVKATFFVTAQDPNHYYLMHEAYKRGHTIALHSYSHNYDEIYASEEAFYDDLEKLEKLVEEQIGYVPCFFRFPGGSSNTISEDYSKGIMSKLTKGMNERGYQYWDWNLDTGDGAAYSTMQMLAEVLPDGTYDDNGNFIEIGATSGDANAGGQNGDANNGETAADPNAPGGFDNPTDAANNENAGNSADAADADSANIDELSDDDEIEGLDDEIEELDDEGAGTWDYPENIVLLCHDAAGKEDTLAALPAIIKYFQSQGYSFEALDRNSMVVHHEVNN